jgi:hypothetical protein
LTLRCNTENDVYVFLASIDLVYNEDSRLLQSDDMLLVFLGEGAYRGNTPLYADFDESHKARIKSIIAHNQSIVAEVNNLDSQVKRGDFSLVEDLVKFAAFELKSCEARGK